MNLRQALKERTKLDNKIMEESAKFSPFQFYKASDQYVYATVSPDDAERLIVEKWRSINDMIERRERINTAINKANAETTVSVDKFVNLESKLKNVKEKETHTMRISCVRFSKKSRSTMSQNAANLMRQESVPPTS